MKATNYNTNDYLKTQDDIFYYIDAALEDGNKEVLFEALRNIAKAKGVNSESLYKTLLENDNLKYETLTVIIKALGFRLSLAPLNEVANKKTAQVIKEARQGINIKDFSFNELK